MEDNFNIVLIGILLLFAVTFVAAVIKTQQCAIECGDRSSSYNLVSGCYCNVLKERP